MKKLLLLLSFILHFSLLAQTSQERLNKNLDDDNSKFTNVGNIGLTFTNFGTYGHGFSKWPEQPSCEFPIGSGIEHLFDGGLWIGAFISDDANGSNRNGPFVTTGAVDASSIATRGGGFEYTNSVGSKTIERSSLLDSKFFDPDAISHQDLLMYFDDINTTYSNGELIVDHRPLGVSIRQETYAWNFPFADFFVISNYWIKNTSNKFLDSLHVGLWTDTVVRNTNITSPRSGGSFYNKGGNGFNDSLKIAYEFDATGDVGFTDSYIGIQYLGSNKDVDSINFVTWQFRNTNDPNFFAPQNDIQRFQKLLGFFGGTNKFNNGIIPASLQQASNRSMLIATEVNEPLAPGDSINITFAFVAAKKFGTDLPSFDTDVQKTNLYSNASWALRAYNGEDKNGNGILEPSEDLDGNGKITRYILPSPPLNPKIKVVPENQTITIYWDKRAEESIDPISAEKDFEGYRLYRTNAGFDLTEAQDINTSLIEIAEFDSINNSIGFNSGFSFVELDEPIKFENDDTEYWYKFEVGNQLNGWQYIYTVTAFDKGDAENNLESLESSPLTNLQKVLPGTPAVDDETTEIGVYPNPYYGSAYWDGSSERLRKIYFYNLPEQCEITIYTLSGDVVEIIYHNHQSNGSDLRWFETFSKDGKQKMSGGERAWDLISKSDQAIATGLYLFTVKNTKTQNIKRGKFLIIK